MSGYIVSFGFMCLILLLASCGERASTYDPDRGRFVDTKEYRRDQINREIDKRELRRDRTSD